MVREQETPTREGPPLVLVVDDTRPDRERIVRWLGEDGRYRVREEDSAPGARTAIADQRPDCVVLDYVLADQSGLDLLSELQEQDPPLPVVMLTGAGHSAVASAALRRGAEDCLTKGTATADVVRHAIESAIERATARRLSAQRHSADQQARLAIQVAERRASFLAEATRRLATAADVATTLDRLARLAVPFIADRAVIDLIDADATRTHRTVVDGDDPADSPGVREPHLMADDDPVLRTLRSGRPQSHHASGDAAIDPRLAAAVGAADGPPPQAVLIVPLVNAGTSIGAMSFVSFDPLRRYDAAERLVAEEIALRGSLAIANATGQATRRRALASAEGADRLLRVLAGISTTLSRPLEPEQALAHVVRQSVPVLGTTAAVALRRNGGTMDLRAEHTAPTGSPLVDDGTLDAVRSDARTVAVRTQAAIQRQVGTPAAVVLAVPLVSPRGVLGVFETVRAPGAMDEDHVRTVTEDVARRVASYVDRVRATQRHSATDAALRSSEQKLQLALGAAGAGVFEIHGDPVAVTLDAAHAALWETRPDEAVPLDAAIARIAYDDREALRDRLTAAFTGGEPFELEYRVDGDGGERWLASRGQQLEDLGPGAGGSRLVGVTFDISQRRAMTERFARERERAQRLHQATAALSGAVDRRAVTDAVRTTVAAAAGATDAFVMLVDGVVEGLRDPGDLPPDLSQVLHDVTRGSRVRRAVVQVVRDDGHTGDRWHAVVPLFAAGALVGAIAYVFDDRVEVDDEYRLFVVALSRHVATALDRALLFDRERQVAESLQRQLLPHTLPERPDVELAARYLPASADVKVGGDWYDAVELDDGGLLFAVGDVMGHGVASASAMGQLRVGLRALATVDPSPAAILTAADRLAADLMPDRYATACVGRVVPAAAGGERVVRLASAGHQPVLHVTCDGDARWLDVDASVPVGVAHQVGLRDAVGEQPFTLGPGSTLLLFTDGLVERPGESLDAGHERLRDAARRIFTTDDASSLEARCDALIDALVETDPREDDIAIMAVRLR